MANAYLLNGWTNDVQIYTGVTSDPVVTCHVGLTEITSWARMVGDSSLYIKGGTNILEMGPVPFAESTVHVVTSSDGASLKGHLVVEASGLRAAPYYNGFGVGLACAFACATVIYFLRGARGGLRSFSGE